MKVDGSKVHPKVPVDRMIHRLRETEVEEDVWREKEEKRGREGRRRRSGQEHG